MENSEKQKEEEKLLRSNKTAVDIVIGYRLNRQMDNHP